MTFMERWYEEVWNKGNESAINEMCDPNVIAHGLQDAQGNEIQGVEAFKTFFHTFVSSLSEIHVDVEATVTEGDLTVARCTVRAKHTGEGLGKAPKGNPLHFTGLAMARLKDGKMTEAWNQFDFNTMFQQME
jgi:predicted ester cyclase